MQVKNNLVDQPFREAESGSGCFEEFKKFAYHFDLIGSCKCFDWLVIYGLFGSNENVWTFSFDVSICIAL